MLVWRKILAHGLKRLATPALHLWRIRHGLVEELALCIKSLATPDLVILASSKNFVTNYITNRAFCLFSRVFVLAFSGLFFFDL